MPALITIHMARKPLAGTVAENALKYGTGSLNIGGTRIGGPKPDTTRGAGGQNGITSPRGEQGRILDDGKGRWPANVILEHLPGCKLLGSHQESFDINHYDGSTQGNFRSYKESDGPKPETLESVGNGQTVDEWACVEGCPVADVDEQSGVTSEPYRMTTTNEGRTDESQWRLKPTAGTVRGHGDSGGASRYFKQVQDSVEEWACVEGCPVADIDEQSGVTVAKRSSRGVGHSDSPIYSGASEATLGFDTVRGFDDKGGASRYFKLVQGRWPANVILQHLPSCEQSGTRKVNSGTGADTMTPTTHEGPAKFGYSPERHQFNYGTEEVANWSCAPGCPVSDVDEQSGVTSEPYRVTQRNEGRADESAWRLKPTEGTLRGHGDAGGASRFFKQSQHNLIAYLLAMASTPTHRAMFINMETYPLWPGDQLLAEPGSVVGLVVQGAITQEHVDEFMRLLPPGGHILRIAPDSQPTGHSGAILLEDAGFEIRDAILLVQGSGRTHYVAKAGRKEREAGCQKLKGKAGHEAVERKEGSAGVNNPRAGAGRTAKHVRNFHPTVKPIAVMERLLSDVPVDSVVLDPFLGSGTTGVACSKTGHSFLGIEKSAEYLEIADARVRHWDRAHVGWQGAEIESDHVARVDAPKPLGLMDLFG
jgi:hypothetical protein